MNVAAGNRAGAVAVAACCLLLAAQRSDAVDYEPISLACLIANADAVIVATLPKKITGQRYTVKKRRLLSGELGTTSVEVIEPAPWRGTTPQFAGREALLFLKRGKDRTWQVIGPSGDGRIALSAEEADVRGIHLPTPGQDAPVYPREDLIDAIAAAGQCYTFEAQPKSVRPIARCDEKTLQGAIARSPLHAGLIRQLRDAHAQGLPCRF
jgi:hypothetical protein